MADAPSIPPLRCHAMTPRRWDDLAAVMGCRRDSDRCWCAYWRIASKDYRTGRNSGRNREVMRVLVDAGAPTGLIGYRGRTPVAWCGVAPRADQERLARGRVLGPVDDVPVWSITCFVVPRPHRGTGLMRPMIAAAVDLARRKGAPAVEAYPIDPLRAVGAGQIYTGLLQPFLDQGFREIARRSPMRPIVRLDLTGRKRP